jgi:hypothetical protein
MKCGNDVRVTRSGEGDRDGEEAMVSSFTSNLVDTNMDFLPIFLW